MLIVKCMQCEIELTRKKIYAKKVRYCEDELAKLNLLYRMVEFVTDYGWLKQDSLRNKMHDFLRSKYSYAETANKHGVTVKSMQDSMMYADKLLRKRIGTSFELLCSGDILGAEREFAIATNYLPSELFYKEIEEKIKPIESAEIDVATCADELQFLQHVSKHYLLLMRLDRKKLEHLMYILRGDKFRYMHMRSTLYQYLEGLLDLEQTLVALTDAQDRC